MNRRGHGMSISMACIVGMVMMMPIVIPAGCIVWLFPASMEDKVMPYFVWLVEVLILAASAYGFWKGWNLTAFIIGAWVIVAELLAYLSRHGF